MWVAKVSYPRPLCPYHGLLRLVRLNPHLLPAKGSILLTCATAEFNSQYSSAVFMVSSLLLLPATLNGYIPIDQLTWVPECSANNSNLLLQKFRLPLSNFSWLASRSRKLPSKHFQHSFNLMPHPLSSDSLQTALHWLLWQDIFECCRVAYCKLLRSGGFVDCGHVKSASHLIVWGKLKACHHHLPMKWLHAAPLSCLFAWLEAHSVGFKRSLQNTILSSIFTVAVPPCCCLRLGQSL